VALSRRTTGLILAAEGVGFAVAVVMTRRVVRDYMRLVEAQRQAWFWTPKWLEGEGEAEADILEGRVERFVDHEDFVKSLMAEPPRAGASARNHAHGA
jgi:hypothetical protein